MVFFFAVKGEGKCEKIEKKKKFFSPSSSFFTIFGRKFVGNDDWEVFSGIRRRSREQKRVF